MWKLLLVFLLFCSKGISQSLSVDETISYLNSICEQHPGIPGWTMQLIHRDDSCKIGVFYKFSYDNYYKRISIQEYEKSYDCPRISHNSTSEGYIFKFSIEDLDVNKIYMGLGDKNTTVIIKGPVERKLINEAKKLYNIKYLDSAILSMVQKNYKTVFYHGLKYLVSIAKEQIPKKVDEVADDPFVKDDHISESNKKTESKIPLIEGNGVFSVKAIIGGKVFSKFVLDSGAGECNISSELEKELIKYGIIKNSDYLNNGLYKLADGTIVENKRVKIPNILIGNKQIKNVIVSIGQTNSPNLLGQSFLNKLDSWSIDNSKKILTVY